MGADATFRGAVFLHILHHASEVPIRGAWMSAELANHGYEISPGTLNPTLRRMENDGLPVSMKTTLDARALGTYTATDAGVAALKDGQRAVRELTDGDPSHEFSQQEGGRTP